MKDQRLYVIHMIECGERILAYTEAGREAFLADPKTQDAVIRNFEIFGEAAKRVIPALRAQASDIPWRQIAGFRDVLIHQYEGVDLEEIWKRVAEDLPPVVSALRDLLAALEGKER